MKGLYDYSEETASDMAARLKANEFFFLHILWHQFFFFSIENSVAVITYSYIALCALNSCFFYRVYQRFRPNLVQSIDFYVTFDHFV